MHTFTFPTALAANRVPSSICEAGQIDQGSRRIDQVPFGAKQLVSCPNTRHLDSLRQF